LGDAVKKMLAAYLTPIAEAAAKQAGERRAADIRNAATSEATSVLKPRVLIALGLGAGALILGVGSYIKVKRRTS
jgi:hypothetical protein